MHACSRPRWFLISCALLAAPLGYAQTGAETTVRTEYAEVLRVEPVSLPAPHTGESARCVPVEPLDPAHPAPLDAHPSDVECVPLPPGYSAGAQVVYDVDYVLRGVKYRSRLPFDPGNRLQVQLSVTPVLPPPQPPPASF